MTTLLLLLAMRVHRNWSGSQRRRDVVLLGLLTAGTIAALGGSVPRWYDAGLDRQQMAHVEAVEFERELQHDPAFNDVEIYVSPKQFYWLKGAVMTPADLERLNAMADASRHVLWNHDVRVIGEARSPDVVPSNR
jgi:hypothetical protein